jgi:hypothetical protein
MLPISLNLMRKSIFVSILLGIFSSYSITEESICGTQSTQQTTQVGGVYVPSIGTIRVLFVYVEFRGDQTDINNPNWPYQQPPTFLNSVVDSVANQPHTTADSVNNFTVYFRNMSFGLYNFLGKTIYLQTPDSLTKYVRENRNRRYVNEQVLKKVDTLIDFAEFDNWTRDADYTHRDVNILEEVKALEGKPIRKLS